MSEGFSDTTVQGEKEGQQPGQPQPVTPPPQPWFQFITKASDPEIRTRLELEINEVVSKHEATLSKYCLLCLYDPHDSISSWDSNRIYAALQTENPECKKDVLLVMVSSGGKIEPAYQISKICKAYAKSSFVVLVPRAAKSAATLIALGADQIHIGVLGELGPIDPQLGDLPALGVRRALETIASVSQEYPGSAETFARYMSRKISIEQIGYSERVVESAEQYAVRLLSKKEALRSRAAKMARQLVHGYKDHGFVIDAEEAKTHLGDTWILTSSPELTFAEEIFLKLDQVDVALNVASEKCLSVVGSLKGGCYIYKRPS